MKKFISALVFMACISSVFSQSDIRAWYAQGQVWIIWKTSQPFPETYAIYKSSQAFTNSNQATPIGRLFAFEYLAGQFISYSGNASLNYRIPRPDGSIYELQAGEGLFVETTSSNGSAFYGVVEWGNANFIPGVNITNTAVNYKYDPINDPVNCHLQLSQILNSGHRSNWYGMWLYGKMDENGGRPDFPVMANAFKNGMPAMFIVNEALGLDTTNGKKVPGTVWLHGGGGDASNFLPNKAQHFDVKPVLGISITHSDDMSQKFVSGGDTVFSTARTAWFGWTKRHNPFNPGFDASPGDTLINYTQRRILWVNNWLMKHYNLDPDRIALQGYSMGSGGVSALGKCFPNLFSTICAFNNGYRRVNEETITGIQGTVEENLPTNILDNKNKNIHINEIMDLVTHASDFRDYPLFRIWAGKNDINDRMHWGPDLVLQYRKMDSIGMGVQLNWDEREHVYNTLGMHWIEDIPANNQTILDNLSTQENYKRNQSFPAFYNHQQELKNNDPGTGIIGINKGDGDNWGTWGGYHNWDLNDLEDSPHRWAVTCWLGDQQLFNNDNCPTNSLVSSLAIRKPQAFKPSLSSIIKWRSEDLANGQILETGTINLGADSLVVIPRITIYKSSLRKVRIIIEKTEASNDQFNKLTELFKLSIYPNPSETSAKLNIESERSEKVQLQLCDMASTIKSTEFYLKNGMNEISLAEYSHLPEGIYFLHLKTNKTKQIIKWIKIN